MSEELSAQWCGRTSKQILALSRSQCSDRGKDKHVTQAQEVREGFLEEAMPELSLGRWVGSRQEDKGRLPPSQDHPWHGREVRYFGGEDKRNGERSGRRGRRLFKKPVQRAAP